jgi:tetratricopeptide (TPR) repeat protein
MSPAPANAKTILNSQASTEAALLRLERSLIELIDRQIVKPSTEIRTDAFSALKRVHATASLKPQSKPRSADGPRRLIESIITRGGDYEILMDAGNVALSFDPALAAAAYRQASSIEPQSATAAVKLGHALALGGFLDQARSILSGKAANLQSDIGKVEALLMLASLEAEFGSTEAAISAYSSALLILDNVPRNSEIQRRMAVVQCSISDLYLQTGKLVSARKLLTSARGHWWDLHNTRDPLVAERMSVEIGLAGIFRMSGDLKNWELSLRSAIEIGAEPPQSKECSIVASISSAYIELCDMALMEGKDQVAYIDLAQEIAESIGGDKACCSELQSSISMIQNRRSNLEASRGNLEAASTHASKSLKAAILALERSGTAEAHWLVAGAEGQKAYILAILGNLYLARDKFRSAVLRLQALASRERTPQITATEVDMRINLANLLQHLGGGNEAQEILRKAQEMAVELVREFPGWDQPRTSLNLIRLARAETHR